MYIFYLYEVIGGLIGQRDEVTESKVIPKEQADDSMESLILTVKPKIQDRRAVWHHKEAVVKNCDKDTLLYNKQQST